MNLNDIYVDVRENGTGKQEYVNLKKQIREDFPDLYQYLLNFCEDDAKPEKYRDTINLVAFDIMLGIR